MRQRDAQGSMDETYDNAWPREHLAKPSRRIDRQRTLKEVLGVEAGVVVDTRAARRNLNRLSGNLDDCRSGDSGLRVEEVESRHDE